jgi:outer membrane protein assembly factor BamB
MRQVVSLLLLAGCASSLLAENWPGWRGPRGDGTSTEKGLPTTWSAKDNVRWKAKLPGPGNSSPIVWGDRIFITQSLDKDGAERAVMCFDRKKGDLLWKKSIPYPAKDKEPTHGTNPYCAATPVTDGERVIASHGSAGVVCYDLKGKQLWHRDLGKFIHVWGTAASPILHGDLVILNCGPGPRTFLLAMNKKAGEDVWKHEEPGGVSGVKKGEKWIGSWSTPRIIKVKEQEQLLMSWPKALKAHELKKGEVIWSCKGLTDLVYTSPVAGKDGVVAMSGFHGAALAVTPGGEGDVTEDNRLWHHAKQNPQRIGSGVIVGDHLYMANADGAGTLQCIEVKTGKDLWAGEGAKLGAAAWGSIVQAEGNLYVTDQRGTTHVFAAKPKFTLVSRNKLGENCNATPAISEGDVFIRTHRHLWCIAKGKE